MSSSPASRRALRTQRCPSSSMGSIVSGERPGPPPARPWGVWYSWRGVAGLVLPSVLTRSPHLHQWRKAMTDSHPLDNLRPGADVSSADNEEVGKLHAVIMDPRDNRVTHIVVNTGPHFPEPGFGAPDLITVPVDEMADAQEEKVILKCTT